MKLVVLFFLLCCLGKMCCLYDLFGGYGWEEESPGESVDQAVEKELAEQETVGDVREVFLLEFVYGHTFCQGERD